MHPDERLLQRALDGDLDHATSRAWPAVVRQRPALAQQARIWEAIDRDLRALAATGLDGDRDEASTAAILARVAAAPAPQARLGVRVDHLLVAGTILVVIALFTWSAADLRPLIPLLPIALACVLIGLLLAIAARPLARLEASLVARLLRHRLVVGDGEILVCRVLGVALVLCGIHIMRVWG